MAREKGKEESKELGGRIFLSPPCFKLPETPMGSVIACFEIYVETDRPTNQPTNRPTNPDTDSKMVRGRTIKSQTNISKVRYTDQKLDQKIRLSQQIKS